MPKYIDVEKLQMEPDPWGGMNGVICLGRSGGKTMATVQATLKRMVDNAPTEAVIPVETVRGYLLGLIDEWNSLGDRAYELPNMQVYNHIRKELDDLEKYTLKHFPNGDANKT